RTKRYFFVGPDNGILSLALENEKILEIRRLENARYFRQPVSATFHGRDVFAPSAAHLGRGIPPSRFGPRQGGYQRLPWLSPVNKKGILHGTTVYVDRFGNVITNLPASWVPAARKYSLRVPGIRKPIPVLSFYEAAPLGSPLVLAGSHGYLEIAVNGGSAARELKIGAQTSVMLRLDH
ncbi:MAG TPA: SAM-dependent chlorinase/fluorinase, partial [Candidatus Paceibacterota bacterium]|nr:SAM-dependent chlorinase/fluorinase [Candidatus Paceibacterota bacterium]